MLRCWDSLAKGGLHHASRQGRVANVTDEQTVTDWEATPVIAYVVWLHTFGAALPQSQIPCAGNIVRQRIHVILKKQPTLRKGDRHESISQP